MKSDIEIAREAKRLLIKQIRERLDISDEEFSPYGRYKGKISFQTLNRLKNRKDGKLIIVTAITPTKYGEGKTTTCIGLSMGINRLGKKSIVTLREPSLGPVFGMKGGAAGGGFSQVLPMEDINLHFTGDIHAVTTANNLLSAVIGNHMHFSNSLRLDSRKILWKRCIDMNDRELRNVVVGLGGPGEGYPREDHFIISAASEIMGILTLSENMEDLKNRICDILVGFTPDDKPVFVKDFKICGAMAAILKEALWPNLVQTIENTPALIHSGPFANISVGTNSLIATRLALKLSEYVVTECGFGSDLGFEKFVDLVSHVGNLPIHAVVLVATTRALKHQGNANDMKGLTIGLANLEKHIDIVKSTGLKPVVAINHFPEDTEEEIDFIQRFSEDRGAEAAVSDVFAKGGEGGITLAAKVMDTADRSDGTFQRFYAPNDPVSDKIERIATKVYGADGVIFSWEAKRKLKLIARLGMDHFPVCIAKTPLSVSDNPEKLNVPAGWRLNINDILIAGGAKYVIPISGDIMLMPGLPKQPSAERIDIDHTGQFITGLF
ncbi:MAG: formate--tetrahydrofolate ligase [Candidatus Omnitrophota bacterium]